MAILHRKNALFYKTQQRASAGDLYMPLIRVCESNGANPFECLTGLQEHADEVAAADRSRPWNYCNAILAEQALRTAVESSRPPWRLRRHNGSLAERPRLNGPALSSSSCKYETQEPRVTVPSRRRVRDIRRSANPSDGSRVTGQCRNKFIFYQEYGCVATLERYTTPQRSKRSRCRPLRCDSAMAFRCCSESNSQSRLFRKWLDR